MKKKTFVLIALLTLLQTPQSHAITHKNRDLLTGAAIMASALVAGYYVYEDRIVNKHAHEDPANKAKIFHRTCENMVKSLGSIVLCGGITYILASQYTPEAYVSYAAAIIALERQSYLVNARFYLQTTLKNAIRDNLSWTDRYLHADNEIYLVQAHRNLTHSWNNLKNASASAFTACKNTIDPRLKTECNDIIERAQKLQANINCNQEIIEKMPLFATQTTIYNTRTLRETLEKEQDALRWHLTHNHYCPCCIK